MYIRPAKPSDFPTLATFSVDAFIDDELYQYTNPFAKKYPENFRSYFLRSLKQRFAQPGFIGWVAVNDTNEEHILNEESRQEGSTSTDAEEIIGYAFWRRYGKSEVAKGWQVRSWSQWLEDSLIEVEQRYISFFGLDLAVSPAAVRSLDAMDQLADDWSLFSERWHLHNLCVDPKFQRRGVGAQLIRWGTEKAADEKVPVTLYTSTIAEPLYRKMGFVTWTRRDWPGVRMDAPSLVYWPPGVEAIEYKAGK